MKTRFHRHDEPLTSQDLDKCHEALQSFCRANDVPIPSEEADRVAAIIIELYQQGIKDNDQLRALVDAARGVLRK